MRAGARRRHCDVACGLARRHDGQCVDESARVDTRREKSGLGPLWTTRRTAAVWHRVDALGDRESRCVGLPAHRRVAAMFVSGHGNGRLSRRLMMVFVSSSTLLIPSRPRRNRRMMPRWRAQQHRARQHHSGCERQRQTDNQAGGTSRRGRHDLSIAGLRGADGAGAGLVPARALRHQSLTVRSRSALAITDTELKVIAALAMIGLKSSPKNGYRAPAAMGTPTTL